MNEVIFTFDFGAIQFLTPWKLIGYLGVLMFGSRWIFQLISTSKQGKPTFPLLFWILSLAGSFMTLDISFLVKMTQLVF